MAGVAAPNAFQTLRIRAPAKVNLTLHVLGRRPDGYHELESLVAFAGAADTLSLAPGGRLSLSVEGPTAGPSGPPERNLVLRAATALVARRPGLATGAFRLVKRLPAAAGIGGGSSDAAAALRLLADLNGLAIDDPDVVGAARETGADIPVCLDPRARMMRGAGEAVGPPLDLPPLFSVLVNPGVAVATADVFRALGLEPGQRYQLGGNRNSPEKAGGLVSPSPSWGRWPERSGGPDGGRFESTPHVAFAERPPPPAPPRKGEGSAGHSVRASRDVFATLTSARNDLEQPALALAPVIGDALDRLRATDDCRLARMSGSGATVFGLYDDCRAAAAAARAVRSAEPGWWVKATVLR